MIVKAQAKERAVSAVLSPRQPKVAVNLEDSRMADIIDMANDRAQAELDAAIAACVGNVSSADSAIWCEECDAQIPEKRRELIKGCRYCVHCQGVFEQIKRSRGGVG